jgi:hypothetical protein
MALNMNDPLELFRSNVESAFGRVGGQISGMFDDDMTARVYFPKVDAYLDVTRGPGGNPIVGRGAGMYVFNRMSPVFGSEGFQGQYSRQSAWDVLGNIARDAVEEASTSRSMSRAFGSSVSRALGTNDLRDNTGIGAQHLPHGYERRLPAAALRRFESTTYVDQVPYRVTPDVYPGMMIMGEARAGMMPMAQIGDLAAASIGGVARGGGKQKQTGLRPYDAMSYQGAQWRDMTTGAGQSHRAMIREVILPLGGSIGPTEGQGTVRRGTTVEQRAMEVQPLTGWSPQDLQQITAIRGGASGQYGEEIPVLMAGDRPLYSWRARHSSFGQVSQAHVSIPEGWTQTAWYKGLGEREREMFRPTGGVAAGGEVVPSLVMQTIRRRGAGGSVSAKGMGMKQMLAEGNIAGQIAGMDASRTDILFEEGIKSPHTALMAIGAGLGVTSPGDTLVSGGQVNQELVGRIVTAMRPHMRTLERTYRVTPGLAAPYLGDNPRVPGIKGTSWIDTAEGPRLEVRREFQAYAGPMAQWARAEYPIAQSKVNPEEMRHLATTNPALHSRIQRTGFAAEGHIGITRAFWAGEGMIDLNQRHVQQYADIQERVGMLSSSGPAVGELARSMMEAGIGRRAISLPGGHFLPSARDILSMSASNPRGEEVSQLIRRWERAVASPETAGEYQSLVGETVPRKNWIKEMQSYTVPGVAGPGVADAAQDPGTVRIGEAQFRAFARRVYGRSVSSKELAEMRGVMERGQVISKFTRFPQSDVFRQNELHLRMRYDPSVAENEIRMHPLVPMALRGDTDADIFRGFTTAFQRSGGGGLVRDSHGRLVINNEGMGNVATEESLLRGIVGMLDETVPEQVAAARREIAGQQFGSEATRLGAIAMRVPYYANEYAKAVEKEAGTLTGSADYEQVIRSLVSNVPEASTQIGKEIGVRESKGMMGRTYNMGRRSVAERARDLWGPDSTLTRDVFAAAASGYQKALDLGRYDPQHPMGRSTGDPLMSWGQSRIAEGFGTMSLWHGGGFMRNITGGIDYAQHGRWTPEGAREQVHGYVPSWRKPVGKYSLAGATNMARNVIADSAIYNTEYTPRQQAAMLSETPEQAAQLTETIASARQWAAGLGDTDPEEALRSPEGLRHRAAVLTGAGLTGEGFWRTQAPQVSAYRDAMLARTLAQERRGKGDEDYSEMIARQRAEIGPAFQQLTGTSLDEAMAGAVRRQGRIMTMAGDAMTAGDPTDRMRARELAHLLPEVAGPNVRRATRPIPRAMPAEQYAGLDALGQLSHRYGLNLRGAGVSAAEVVGQESYRGPAGTAGYTMGTSVTVRQATPSEAQRAGATQWELTRRRLAHEMGHAAVAADPDLRAQATASVPGALQSGRLSQEKLEAQYGEEWRAMAPGELVAQAYGQSVGQVPTYSGDVSQFDVEMSRRASSLSTLESTQAASAGGAGRRPPGGASFLGAPPAGGPPPQDEPPPGFFADDPGPGPGKAPAGNRMGSIDLSKMSPKELGQFMGTMARATMSENYGRKPVRTRRATRLAYEIAGGNVGALEGPTAQSLASSGNFDELENLQRFEKWMTGEGGAPTGSSRYIAWQLRQMGGSPKALAQLGGTTEFPAGMTPDQALAANRAVSQQALGVGRRGTVPTQLAEFDKALQSAAENLVKHEQAVIKATEGYSELSKEQVRALKAVQGEAGGVSQIQQALASMGQPGQQMLDRYSQAFGAAGRISQAGVAQAQRTMDAQYASLAGSGFGQRIGGAAQSLYRDLTSGWGMMRINRLWGMTGGRAMQAQGVAMQQEMAVQGALASWTGGGQLGDVSRGLLGIRSRTANAQAAMGRGAHMAYGPIQQDLAGGLGEFGGIALPALGAGMIGQSLLGGIVGGPVGLAIGATVGAVGSYNYLAGMGSDRNERDYRMGGGFWSQTVGQLGDIIASGGMRSRGEYQAQMARGRQLRSGDMAAFEGDGAAQGIVLRHWAQQQSSVMSTEQWAQTAGQWQAAMGNVGNLNDIPTDLLERGAIRGYNIPQMVQLTRGLGGTTGDFQGIYRSMLEQPNSMATTNALSQYAGAGRLGLASPQWFAQNMGGLQEMTGWQANRFGQMMGGDRLMWSRYAAGDNLGLTGTAMDLLGQVGRQDWMTTVEPGTGLPLHTTTGARYSGRYGSLSTPEAQQGGLRGIQWAYITQQSRVAEENEGRRWDRFQMGYAYKTGGALGGYAGSVSPGLMSMIQQTGGVWGLEDQQRQAGYQWQQYQFGYQQQSFDMSNRQWMENWGARYGRWRVESQWQDEDVKDQTAKWARQDENWLYNWNWQENMADLQFGWQMEDLDEGIRYATGRQKLQLMRRKERATITEGMRGDRADEAKDYWEDMKKFREEDIEKEKARREQRNQWAEEDMQRSKRHHEERTDLQQSHMDAQREHYESTFQMQERRIQLDRRYWQEMQKAQADDMRRANEINVMQRRLREDQWKLNTDAMDAMYRFRMLISEIGTGIDTLTRKAREFNSSLNSSVVVQNDPDPVVRDSGGPVGLFNTADHRFGAGAVMTQLEQGEYVVPRGGALVQRDDRVVEKLSEIANLLREGNGRFTIMVSNPEQGVSDVSGALDAAYNN